MVRRPIQSHENVVVLNGLWAENFFKINGQKLWWDEELYTKYCEKYWGGKELPLFIYLFLLTERSWCSQTMMWTAEGSRAKGQRQHPPLCHTLWCKRFCLFYSSLLSRFEWLFICSVELSVGGKTLETQSYHRMLIPRQKSHYHKVSLKDAVKYGLFSKFFIKYGQYLFII